MAQAFNLLTTFGPWVTLFTVLFIVAYIGVTFFVRTKMKHIDDKFSDITKSFEKVNLRFDEFRNSNSDVARRSELALRSPQTRTSISVREEYDKFARPL